MPDKYTQYFNNMQPNQILSISKAKNPAALIQAGKNYIDAGGQMIFKMDWSEMKKLEPMPIQSTTI